jgi:hypothetical protein
VSGGSAPTVEAELATAKMETTIENFMVASNGVSEIENEGLCERFLTPFFILFHAARKIINLVYIHQSKILISGSSPKPDLRIPNNK